MTPRVRVVRAALARTTRSSVKSVSRRLPADLQEPFLRLARTARDVALGSSAATPRPGGRRRHQARFQVTPPPRSVPGAWPEPPAVESPKDRTAFLASYSRPDVHRFDIELFEQLNEEYRTKPIWPSPPLYDPATLSSRAYKRLMEVHSVIDLADKRVLEVGCGTGYDVWYLAHYFGSDAHGMDVATHAGWDQLVGEKVHLHWADITEPHPLPHGHFDRVISFVVWEHITHPFRALQEVYRLLKPGGLCWLHANLDRGPVASHLYREIFFPWPHLLFSDEVIREFYRRHGLEERGTAWVNKLTWAQYERYFELIGFRVRMVQFKERPLDTEFVRRFAFVLDRYPTFDLTKDFFTAVLERPRDR